MLRHSILEAMLQWHPFNRVATWTSTSVLWPPSQVVLRKLPANKMTPGQLWTQMIIATTVPA